MKKMRLLLITALTAGMIGTAALTGCASPAASSDAGAQAADSEDAAESASADAGTVSSDDAVTLTSASGALIDASELYTERDLAQTADLSGAVTYTVADGQEITITQEGVYVLTGTAKNVTVFVEADSEAKVQIVLDGVSITNESAPCIYVKSADKVFVTTTDSDNVLAVTGTFASDGDTNPDGVIFAKDDLVLKGTGTLTITSTDNGVVCKDDLKVTGGTYAIAAADTAIEANDSIRICGGTFDLTAGSDGLHAENDEDDSVGWISISGGTITITAGDDGIHGTSVVEIDDGTIAVTAGEGIEGTCVQINGGTVSVSASDDGINAAYKSASYSPVVEITGGEITITMGAGDTDAVDSNGDLIISGGTLDITAQSPFDYDGSVEHTGGTIIVNGQQVDSIQNQMMGGGMQGGPENGAMPGNADNGGTQGGFGGGHGRP